MSTLGLLSALMKREFRRLASRRIYWFILILAPAFCFIFFADLLKQGLPMKLPIAVVDEDNTSLSRQLVRSLDAMAQTEVVMRTASFKEAREAMQTSRIASAVFSIYRRISDRRCLSVKDLKFHFIQMRLICYRAHWSIKICACRPLWQTGLYNRPYCWQKAGEDRY